MEGGGALTIWVRPEYRGLGVAEALLTAIETVYRLNGHTEAEAPSSLPGWLNTLLHQNG